MIPTAPLLYSSNGLVHKTIKFSKQKMAFYSGRMVKETPKKKSPFLAILTTFVILLAVGGYFLLTNKTVSEKLALYRCYWDPKVITQISSGKEIVPVTISAGLEPLQIGKQLQDKGIISRATDFLCYVRKIDAGNKLQAGYYEIQQPVSLEQLVPLLQSSRIPTFRVTLQEGLRMDEIANKIDAAMGDENSIKTFSKSEFLTLTTDKTFLDTFSYTKGKTSIEGFLFPDTYEIAKNSSARDVIELLTKTFARKVSETTLDSSTKLTPYQVVVLASILEKEAGKSFEEKQTIAGILMKRMENNWLLQVDATFLYEKKDWKAPIYQADKENNSLYNTYKRIGLPPTPICNPGIENIKAVLAPKSSPYWYYLHGTDGVVRYGKTLAEHQQNISLYLR